MNNLVLNINKDANKYITRINQSLSFKPNTYDVRFFVAVKKEDEDFEPCFIAGTCRSYMGEGIFSLKATKHFPKTSRFNKEDYAFGYQFSPAFDYLKGSTYIGIEVVDKDKMSLFKERFSFLNSIEKEFNIPLSTYTILENKPYIIMVEGSPMWKDSCWKIQLYTYMLKSLMYAENNPSEKDFMKLVKKYYKELFSNIHMAPEDEIFDSDTYGHELFNRHILTGFVSICSGLNRPMANLLGINCEKEYNPDEDSVDEYGWDDEQSGEDA